MCVTHSHLRRVADGQDETLKPKSTMLAERDFERACCTVLKKRLPPWKDFESTSLPLTVDCLWGQPYSKGKPVSPSQAVRESSESKLGFGQVGALALAKALEEHRQLRREADSCG